MTPSLLRFQKKSLFGRVAEQQKYQKTKAREGEGEGGVIKGDGGGE
jgi:hypothetical protein